MKSIKILTAIALVLVFTMSSFGATGDYPGADKLKEFGFVRGYDGDLMTDRHLTRSQACVLLAQLHGEIGEAEKYTRKSEFSDVKESEWYAPYVNYAHSRKWFDGYPDGSFGPDDFITVQAWAKLMLTVLNRFENWENAVSDLKKTGVRIYAVDSLKMKRGEAFDAMWAVVNTPAKGDDVPLGVKLGKLRPKHAQIVGMEMPSLKTLEIKVSEKLVRESAEKPENYIFLDSEEKPVAVQKVVYDASSDRIEIVFDRVLKEDTELLLSDIRVITENNGNLLPAEFGTYRVKDTRAPEIVDIVSLGTKAFKVFFSEPIMGKEGELSKKNDFILDKQLSVKRIFLTEDDTAAVVELYSVISGPLSVYPQKSIRDYSGLSLMSDTKKYTVEMKPDLTIPKIEKIVKASSSELVVELNKNMVWTGRLTDGIKVGNRRADSGAYINGKMLHLTFRTNYIPVGTSELVIQKGVLDDYSGVQNVEMRKEFEIPADFEIPFSKDGVKVEKQNQVRITFNEPLKKSVLSKTNYKLMKGSEDVSGLISNVNYDPIHYTIILNMSRDLFGEYRLEIKEVPDLSGNDGATYYDFEVGDVTAPNPQKWSARLYRAGESDQFILIRFDEAMSLDGMSSVLNPSNYMYGDTVFDQFNPERLKIEMIENGDAVKIQYPGQRYGGIDFEANGAKKFSVSRISDIAGNKVPSFVNTLVLEKNSTMKIDKAGLVDFNVIVLEVRDEVEYFDESDIVFESGGKTLKGSFEDVSAGIGLTTFRFVLEETPKGPISVKTKAGRSQNQYGDGFMNSAPVAVVDKIGPRLLQTDGKDAVTYTRSSGTITMLFSEDLNSKVVSLLSFEVPGVKIDDIHVHKNEVRIVIASEDRGNITLDTSVIQLLELRDMQGNATNGISAAVNQIK